MNTKNKFRFSTGITDQVNGMVLLPEQTRYFLLFAHGAGAGMDHPFMEKMSEYLAGTGIGTFRFNFPYVEKKLKKPDVPSVLLETIKAAFEKAKEYAGEIPLIAGGKSMGGRMTSVALQKGLLPDVKGIVFFGFPLHGPGKPSVERAAQFSDVNLPMLFLQGTKDKLAYPGLLIPILEKMENKVTLHLIDEADHSFHLPKRAGKNDEDVLKEMAGVVKNWADRKLIFQGV